MFDEPYISATISDGEVDTRATYTALSVAALLNLLTDELTAGCAEYLITCQVSQLVSVYRRIVG